jgi:hypothetical protein
MVGLSLPVPFAAQVRNGWEVGPIFPHAASLPQQTQAILSLELRNQLLHGVVDQFVWGFAQALRQSLQCRLFLFCQVQSCYGHRALSSIVYVTL